MRYLILFLLSMVLVSCGNNYGRPKKMYIRDFMGVDPKIQEVVAETLEDLNAYANEDFIFFGSGEKPVTVRNISPENIGEEVFAHARYLEYHCLIQVREDLEDEMRSVVNPSFPHLVSEAQWKNEAKKIIMHELGHCAGLGHVNDPTNIMNPTYSSQWNSTALEKFAKLLRDITR